MLAVTGFCEDGVLYCVAAARHPGCASSCIHIPATSGSQSLFFLLEEKGLLGLGFILNSG